jgi:hypothetical protein
MTRRRNLLIVATVIVASAMTLAAPLTRTPILKALGEALIAKERPVIAADVIVVAIDARSAGVLEAADLVDNGVATRVAVFATGPGKVDAELVRRGIWYEDPLAMRVRQLESLGVRNVVPLPRVSGTEEQGRVLPGWCEQHGFRSVVVVTSWYHSRRLARVLHRSMRNSDTTVFVRVSRHSDFEPENWWQTREGARAGITELQKLLWDVARHPFS